jgi:hypothetical protein
MKTLQGIFFVLLVCVLAASATIIHVPGQYTTVQAGINAASDGDTVLVGPGTYTQQVTIQNAAIHLLSSAGADCTIIRYQGGFNLPGVVTVYTSSEIAGFMIWRYTGYDTGPALKVMDGSPFVHHNILCSSADASKGVIIQGTGSPMFLNNTIFCVPEPFDSYAHGIEILSATVTPTIKNNIVHASILPSSYCVYNPGNTGVNHSYNDFYGAPLMGITLGLGEFNSNPLYISEAGGNYHLQPISPCVDTGIPILLDPDSTRSDMGCFYYPQQPSQFDLTLTPLNPPIIIPAQGGSFNFNIGVINHGPNQTAFAVWAKMKQPDGSWTGPTLGPVNINPPVGTGITRLRTQNIPGTYQTGQYYYAAFTALVYPGPVVDSTYFTFTKSATASTGSYVQDDQCTGDPFTHEVAGETTLPSAFALTGAVPNPFNPTTAISFKLQAAIQVSLKVYDTAGRLVTTLADGWQEVGEHQVTFNGSSLASGLYFVRMEAGDYHTVQKLVLLK